MTEETLVDVEITPNSKTFAVIGYDEWTKRLRIKVKGQPLKGKANKEITKELSELIGADVLIVKGQKSSKKTLLIRANAEEVKKRLNR